MILYRIQGEVRIPIGYPRDYDDAIEKIQDYMIFNEKELGFEFWQIQNIIPIRDEDDKNTMWVYCLGKDKKDKFKTICDIYEIDMKNNAPVGA